MPLDIVVGTQWGDEGKGRVVDLLSESADFVARFNGGDNAGHTVTVGDRTFKLHLVPSGIVHPHTVGVIGNGVVINPAVLVSELETLQASGIEISPKRLCLSYAAHLISPVHRAIDQAQETWRGQAKLGTTLRGIGPAYAHKISRQGIRLGEIIDPERFEIALRNHISEANHLLTNLYSADPIEPEMVISEYLSQASKLIPYIGDASALLSDALSRGKRVLAEGAQGTLLDLDHGTYPFVTSSNPIAPAALVGLGLGLGSEERVIGVTKAFQTRVGAGPFPTELEGELASRLRGTGEHPWDEFGTTTGRPRRVGWLDAVLLRYSSRINGLTEIALTKLDILSGIDPIKICTRYRFKGNSAQQILLDLSRLDEYEPVYEDLEGWEGDISHARKWEELPPQARAFILRIEELIGVQITLISVGPERQQVIEVS